MNEESRNFHESIKTPEKVVEKINKLANHQSLPAQISKIALTSDTLSQLTIYFKFTAPIDENSIHAFENSYCTDSTVFWEISDRVNLEDL